MRGFIAAVMGGGIGFAQFLLLAVLSLHEGESIPVGEAAGYVFLLTWIAEFFALVVIGMYRFAPWIARLLKDDWEAERINRDKREHVSLLEWVAAVALLIRAIVRFVDTGHLTLGIAVVSAFALVPFVVPRPRKMQSS